MLSFALELHLLRGRMSYQRVERAHQSCRVLEIRMTPFLTLSSGIWFLVRYGDWWSIRAWKLVQSKIASRLLEYHSDGDPVNQFSSYTRRPLTNPPTWRIFLASDIEIFFLA